MSCSCLDNVCSSRQCIEPISINILINDIGDAMSEQDAPLLLDHRITHLLYADDILLLSTIPKGLQYNIDKVNELCNNWDSLLM